MAVLKKAYAWFASTLKLLRDKDMPSHPDIAALLLQYGAGCILLRIGNQSSGLTASPMAISAIVSFCTMAPLTALASIIEVCQIRQRWHRTD